MSDISCNYGPFSGPESIKNVLGHAAVALRGHDAGKIYFVVGVRDRREGEALLLLSDGKNRPIAKPKVKKPKHVTLLRYKDEELEKLLSEGRRVDDAMLIHSVKKVRSVLNSESFKKEV